MFEIILGTTLLFQLIYAAKVAVAKRESSYQQAQYREKSAVVGDYSGYAKYFYRHHVTSIITGFITLTIAIFYTVTHQISLWLLVLFTICYFILIRIVEFFMYPKYKREASNTEAR